MGIKLGVVAALGTPAVAVLIFEVLLNATSMFNHGNIRLPERLDRVLRWLVVTPDMHRVHHSVLPRETNKLGWCEYLVVREVRDACQHIRVAPAQRKTSLRVHAASFGVPPSAAATSSLTVIGW
jgi:hypothetical protein